MNIGKKFNWILESDVATSVAIPKDRDPVLIKNDTTGKVVGLLFGDGTTAIKDLTLIGKETDLSFYYTQTEVDNLFTAFGTNLIWKGWVADFAALSTEYPTPEDNWTVVVEDASDDPTIGDKPYQNVDYRYDIVTQTWINLGTTSVPLATQSIDGKMSAADKTKLDGVAIGATKNTNTDELIEGATNKYFTEERSLASKFVSWIAKTADAAIGIGTSIADAIGILEWRINQKENSIGVKGTAFNKNFGTGNTDVARGDHNHDALYEPKITTLSDSKLSTNVGLLNRFTTFLKGLVAQTDIAGDVAFKAKNSVSNATGDLQQWERGATKVASMSAEGKLDITDVTKAGVKKWIDQTYVNEAFLSVTNEVPPTEIVKLENADNWTGNVYTGEPIINTQANDYYNNATYFYF